MRLQKFNIYFTICLVLGLVPALLNAQIKRDEHAGKYVCFSAGFANAPFPHPLRAGGHTYQGKAFPAAEHYSDSSVLICVPNSFIAGEKTNYVVYFHGWYSNIDSSVKHLDLLEQFAQSGINAVFVFPEGPKNSPDSFGGKLEDKDVFKNLIDETAGFLRAQGIDAGQPGKIILAGHSGAFRVMSRILFRGGLTDYISDVILFDALYSQTEKYIHWIENSNGRLVNIYTDEGGTKGESEAMMEDLKQWNIPYVQTEEDNCTDDLLKSNRLVFIHSKLGHSEVIGTRKQFLKFLKTSTIGR